MAVQKFKPKNIPRSLEIVAQEQRARVRETIASSAKSIEKARKLVKTSRELVAEMKQLKKRFL